MMGYDVISELYYGNLRPNDMTFRKDSRFSIALEAFCEHEEWFSERLTDEAKHRFLELINCHDEITGTTAYENFRNGFRLGVMLMMDACADDMPAVLCDLK